MSVAILVPVLNRPAAVQPLLENIAKTTPEPHRVLFVTDEDDTRERAAIAAAGGQELVVSAGYAAKINAAVAATSEPYVFLGADDLRFHAGWLPEALAWMRGQVGVVGTNDLGNRRVIAGLHATHSLVARAYIEQHGTIDQPGHVLHEGYHHNFCDDELVATAKRRRAWAFARDSIVEHLHPNWQKGEDDATYRLGMRRFRQDRDLFFQRSALWT